MRFEIYCEGEMCGEGEVSPSGVDRLVRAFKESGFSIEFVPRGEPSQSTHEHRQKPDIPCQSPVVMPEKEKP
jgi:hypothetical protein